MPRPKGKRGRQQQFVDAVIQLYLTPKVLFDTPLRQTTGFVESLLKLVELDQAVPDFNRLIRRQKTPNFSPPHWGGEGPLNLRIDGADMKLKAKVNGLPASKEAQNDASGGRQALE